LKKICALLLAAGESTRMKSPKQLLEWENMPLLTYQIKKLMKLPFFEIVVVLGHESEKIRNQVELRDTRVTFLQCMNYSEGQSASFRCGLEYIEKEYDGVFVMLVDLPLIRLETMNKVLKAGIKRLEIESPAFVIRPSCDGRIGHPVFIGHFSQLPWRNLTGDAGANKLLAKLQQLEFLDTDDAGICIDIDTPSDYQLAKGRNKLIFSEVKP
jgi:molybdenum cofactor cytidylyltransferase